MPKIARILQKKEERRTKLQRSLNSIVQSLKEMGAQKIILFGSLASGDVDVNSDLDLFVLMPSAKAGKEWTDIIYSTVVSFNSLQIPPGNKLETLKGDRQGQYSIRINNQFQICFTWTPDGPERVEIADYH